MTLREWIRESYRVALARHGLELDDQKFTEAQNKDAPNLRARQLLDEPLVRRPGVTATDQEMILALADVLEKKVLTLSNTQLQYLVQRAIEEVRKDTDRN